MNNIISDKRLKEILVYMNKKWSYRSDTEKQIFLDCITALYELQDKRDSCFTKQEPEPTIPVQPEVYGLRELTAMVKELEMKLIDPMYLFNKFATNEALEVLGNRIKDLEGEIRRIHYAISFKDDEGAVY